MIGQGLIQAVRIATAGSYLAADAALAATSLVLESVLDFSTDGGQLTLNGVTYTYTAADYDTATLTLSTGLTGAALTVDRVDVSPLSTEKLALVTTAGAGDAVSARIPHALVDRVPEGIREPGDEESVQYSLDNGEFVITDVVGRTPAIGAEYVPEINNRFPITETDITDGAISTPKLAADAIDGMTITGALLRSATDTAGRVEVGEDPLQPGATDTEVRIFTADPAETDPARFSGIAVTPGNFLAQVKGFDHTAPTTAPRLVLRTTSTESAAEIEADDRFSVFAPSADFSGSLAVAGALTKAGVPVVTTTDAATLTNKDLSAASNVFPATLTPRAVYKTADTTINNSTALATDPHLQIAGIAAGTYALDALVIYSSSAVADWKGFMTGTGSLSDRLLQVLREPLTGNEYGVSEGAVTFTAAGNGVGAKRSIRIVGTFTATAGSQAFNLQWAQNTTDPTDTVVHKGSYYRIQKIA